MIGMIYRELLNMEIWNSRQTDDDADETQECEINFNVRASAKNFWNVGLVGYTFPQYVRLASSNFRCAEQLNLSISIETRIKPPALKGSGLTQVMKLYLLYLSFHQKIIRKCWPIWNQAKQINSYEDIPNGLDPFLGELKGSF